jgi:hypothetical protein
MSIANYLAGFFDGDGSITVEKLKQDSFTLRIKFCQSNLKCIQEIQSYYPFLKYDGGLRNDIRCEYQLRAAGQQNEPLLDDLLKFSILKYEQLLEAKKFFQYINVKNTYKEKEAIYNRLKELKKTSEIKPYDRLNIKYIAGLFDAEGSIGIYNNSLRVKITQKSDRTILEKIAELYNNTNTIDNYAIAFYGTNAKNFLEEIKPFCIYKTPQIDLALKYMDTLNEKITPEIKIIREKISEQLREEKTIDIETGIQFKNQEEHRNYVIKCFENFSQLSTDDLMYSCKLDEITKTKVMPKFENKIFNLEKWEGIDIIPVLEFCETPNQLSLYQYYRKKVSSLPYTGVVGRAIRILVKDSISNNYIGIICLSSDVYHLGERDRYMLKTGNIENINLKHFMNISCCVPLQPFGFNTNGGKLLASLVFSREVFDYHVKKYNEPIFGFITTSIHGKSIQYDRLHNLKFIGFTKGFGSVHVPKMFYDTCKEYNNTWKIIKKTDRIDRFTFLKNLITHLNLSHDLLLHGNKRGIYFGYLFCSKFDSKFDLSELQNVDQIYRYWKTRWCDNRIKNVINFGKLKTEIDLYTIEKLNTVSFKQYKNPIIFKKHFNDTLIKNILQYKSRSMTLNEIAIDYNKQHNTSYTVNDISKIFTGKIKPSYVDSEYIDLFNSDSPVKNKTKDNISLKKSFQVKVNNEILLEIFKLKNQVNTTTQDASDIIRKKFNIIIKRNIISKIWNGTAYIPDELKSKQEYLDMIDNKKRRTVKAKKFTREELDWIEINNLDKSLGERCKLFEQQFNKTITKTYLLKLKK